jgi:tRNA (guanine-N7-)-methyltransferase
LFDRLEPLWCLDEVGGKFDPAVVFGRDAPLLFEIGIGSGESLTSAAVEHPEIDLIGADVHTPGIAATLARIDSIGLTNVRLLHGDAMVFLGRLAPGSLAGIRILFPDPWPKARHRHRRITSAANIDRFVSLLQHGGTLHVATDIAEYALATQHVCAAHPELAGGVVARPDWRVVTRYETKGIEAGRTATDLIYSRVS